MLDKASVNEIHVSYPGSLIIEPGYEASFRSAARTGNEHRLEVVIIPIIALLRMREIISSL